MAQPISHTELLGLLPKNHVQSAGRLGLCLVPDLDPATWSKTVAHLVQRAGKISGHRDTLTAWLGDLLVFGGDRYRGQIKQYASASGLAPQTLHDAKLVCSRIPVSRRRESLSWSHHCEIGKTLSEIEDVEHWLGVAERDRLSKSELRRLIRAHVAGKRNQACGSRGDLSSASTLALMRELRGLSRLVPKQQAIWSAWAPETCQKALEELEPLADFIAALREKADVWEHSR